jgi:hypothetical protein
MGQKSIPIPAVVAAIAVLVLVVGVFLYKGVTGGTVGDGKAGNVQASPPGQQHGSAVPGSPGQKAP